MENLYLKTKEKKYCNGCGLCMLKCPVGAIEMVEDSEGFEYPVINSQKCIKCNKCKKTCSNFNNQDIEMNLAYCAVSKSKKILETSTSGGIFFEIAKYVIENKGVVFGVECDNDLSVKHNFYETLEECRKFQGSKYVRSSLNDSYKKVKEFLDSQRMVLFTGTPCQCNGLKCFLNKKYDNLILCDIVCHSNPSPMIFKKYILEKENQYEKKIVEYIHRPKDKGWHYTSSTIKFDDGTMLDDRLYFDAFGQGLISRPSCYFCYFSGMKRITDITIGDLWGVTEICKDYKDRNTGISLLVVNSELGKKIVEEIKDCVDFLLIDKKRAFLHNHHEPIFPHKNREKFFSNNNQLSVHENIRNCLKVSLTKKIFRKLKKIIIRSTLYEMLQKINKKN